MFSPIKRRSCSCYPRLDRKIPPKPKVPGAFLIFVTKRRSRSCSLRSSGKRRITQPGTHYTGEKIAHLRKKKHTLENRTLEKSAIWKRVRKSSWKRATKSTAEGENRFGAALRGENIKDVQPPEAISERRCAARIARGFNFPKSFHFQSGAARAKRKCNC